MTTIGLVTGAIATVAALLNAGCSGSNSDGAVVSTDKLHVIATTNDAQSVPVHSTGKGSHISVLTTFDDLEDTREEHNDKLDDVFRRHSSSTLFESLDSMDKCVDVIAKPHVREDELREFQSSVIYQTEDWLFDDSLFNRSPVDAIRDTGLDSDIDNWYLRKYVKWLVSSLTMSFEIWSAGLDRLPETYVKREWIENRADILAADASLSDEGTPPPPAADYQVVMPEKVIRRVFARRQLCVEKSLLANAVKNHRWQSIKGNVFNRVFYMRRAGLDVSSMAVDLPTYGANLMQGILDMKSRLETVQLNPNIPVVDQIERSALIKLIVGDDGIEFDVYSAASPFYATAFELVASKPDVDNNGHPKISFMVPNRMLNISEWDRNDGTGFFELFSKAVKAFVEGTTKGRPRNNDYFTNAVNKNQVIAIFNKLLQVVQQEIDNLKNDRVYEDMQIQEINEPTNRSLDDVRNRINQFLQSWP